MTVQISKATNIYPVKVHGIAGLCMPRADSALQVMFFRECVDADTWRRWSQGQESKVIMAYIEDVSTVERVEPVKRHVLLLVRLFEKAREIRMNHEKTIAIRADTFRSLIENFISPPLMLAQETVNDLSIGNETYLTINDYRFTVYPDLNGKAIIHSAYVRWTDDDQIERTIAK